MNERLSIAVPLHNRLAIASHCIPTVHAGMGADDCLAVYNDGTTEPDPEDRLHKLPWSFMSTQPAPIGIEEQRRRHFFDFADRPQFTHLYLTDADALHDPQWRAHALRLQETYGGAPVCLYNTHAHEWLDGNTIEDNPDHEVIFRQVAPGISYLLTREQAMKVVDYLMFNSPRGHWNWDWTVPSILGRRMAISRMSYVDHIGLGGYHHPSNEGLDGGDRATTPTPWLIQKRAEVVKALS